MMRHGLRAAVCILLILSFFIPAAAVRAESEQGIYVIEMSTLTTLSEENADAKIYPAGLTKLMSFLLFFEALDNGEVKESDVVTVSPNAASKGGTSVFLDAGSSYTFAELLKAAIVSSGNDAAVALAEHISGSEAAFTGKMNERAKELSVSPAFADPAGLDKKNLFSARELGRIACELCKHNAFYKYSTIWTYTFTHNSGRATELTSANKLIKTQGFDGITTGSSSGGGYCLAASASSGKARFIAIILGAPNSETRFETARTLLNEACASYSVYEASRKGARVKSQSISGAKKETVDICAAEDLVLLINKQDEQGITKSIEIGELKAPLKAGDTVGALVVTLPDGEQKRVDLV
ncbi:MAG: D-alanyl-D-alanine carboxypeptidase, partial [Clostridia bacterium]|nr:D-alanyl-D-alanine carboxypeptidase [Clostridia bacterium]